MSDLTRRQPNEETKMNRLKGVSLVMRKSELVQRLPNFDKSKHRVPDEINDRSQRFVGSLSRSQVREDLDEVFQTLRVAFRFKRTQMQTHETDDGAGSITTPYFRYTSCVYQNPANAAELVWQRDVSEVKVPDELLSDQFSEAFGLVFDTVEFMPSGNIDLEKLVDTIEEIDDDRVSLEYDRQLTYCEVYLEGSLAKLQVTSDAFRIVHPEPTPPRELVSSFFEFQEALVDFSD